MRIHTPAREKAARLITPETELWVYVKGDNRAEGYFMGPFAPVEPANMERDSTLFEGRFPAHQKFTTMPERRLKARGIRWRAPYVKFTATRAMLLELEEEMDPHKLGQRSSRAYNDLIDRCKQQVQEDTVKERVCQAGTMCPTCGCNDKPVIRDPVRGRLKLCTGCWMIRPRCRERALAAQESEPLELEQPPGSPTDQHLAGDMLGYAGSHGGSGTGTGNGSADTPSVSLRRLLWRARRTEALVSEAYAQRPDPKAAETQATTVDPGLWTLQVVDPQVLDAKPPPGSGVRVQWANAMTLGVWKQYRVAREHHERIQ